MVVLFFASIATWYLTRDALPSEVRVATGAGGGLYHKFGSVLQSSVERRTRMDVQLVETEGSLRNRQLLLAGKVEAAVVQGDFLPDGGLAVIAPLYEEMVHLIVRQGSGIRAVRHLEGKRVLCGREGSGMREVANFILKHHELTGAVDIENEDYFMMLKEDRTLDAAIVTSGVMNPDLVSLLKTGEFDLIDVTGAEAMSVKNAFLQPAEIPSGLYGERPRLPFRPIETVKTTAFLVARQDASPNLVQSLLESIYEENLAVGIPLLLSRGDALRPLPTPYHAQARQYFYPTDRVGYLTNIMESMVAMKELLFAFFAGCYLLWTRWQKLREKERLAELELQKDHLDLYMDRALAIEKRQMYESDWVKLNLLLEELTALKLEALKEFTDEDLRAGQSFSIFLLQCSNLMNGIQSKLLGVQLAERKPARRTRKKGAT